MINLKFNEEIYELKNLETSCLDPVRKRFSLVPADLLIY